MKSKWIVLPGLLCCLASARAQDVQVQVATEEPPHYVGVGAIVQLTVEGLEAKPEPKCTIESPTPGIRARLAGISPRVVQQMFQSGNQIRRVQQVTHTIQFRVTATKAGQYKIGPFLISQNGVEKRVDSLQMTFQEVPTTDDMRIKLGLPETAYPDQRVPVEIQWWFAGDTENVNSLNIDSPLFDDFRFAPDRPAQRRGSRMPIQTSQGPVSLAATAREEIIDGKRFTVVAARRTLIPRRPGKYEFAPITATIELVTQWQRRRSAFDDLGFGGSLFDEAFGRGRRAAKVELFRASGQPLTFLVKPFPNENRPDSFAGAVGSGFSLDVAADRTVVRVGDPIRLTINLRGDGNIEGASLPSLSADGGLDPDRFRLPEGDAAGTLDSERGAKQFAVSVRVLDESVDEIPAIAYSWFDPNTESYQSTRSKPIALRVMPAQVVGVESVVTSQPPKPRVEAESSTKQQDLASNSQSGRSFSLSGADLAIVRDPDRLMVASTNLLTDRLLQIAGYGLGSLCVLIAWVDRRRRQVDPAVRKAAATLHDQRNRISAAARKPVKDAAIEIAAALQTAAAVIPDADRKNINKIMSDCEAIAYQPSHDNKASISQDIIDRALAAIGELKRANESS